MENFIKKRIFTGNYLHILLVLCIFVGIFFTKFTEMGNKKQKNKITRQPAKIPMNYIEAIADKIHSMNPTKTILINTLKEFAQSLMSRGYIRRIDDGNYFRIKREKHITIDWNKEKDAIDDIIHNKIN